MVGILEERRKALTALDHQAGGVFSLKGEKDLQIISLEREVVQILKEQSTTVKNLVQEGEVVSRNCMELITKCKFPWPPKGDSTADDVTARLDDWDK